MPRRSRALLFVVFAVTGFSALALQVVWQRVISLHAGVDLVSFTTVVAAFLAGIGLGSLGGGTLADRLGPRRSIAAFAVSNAAIGVFAFVSLYLFDDLYRALATGLSTPWTKFAFNVVLLLVPTTLMGVSLPLVARGVVERIADAGGLVGSLYAVNTLGAAVGAAVTGWVLLGSVGFTATVRLAGALNLLAAAAVALVHRSMVRATDAGVRAPGTPVAAPASTGADDEAAEAARIEPTVLRWGLWPWYLLYALTGAVALGFEVVFFRTIDTIMRSNSYSFGHVLSVYLLLFGAGAALASPVVRRTHRPAQWFLWLQFAVGVTALGGVVVLTKGLVHTPWADQVRHYFATEGFSVGFRNVDGTEHTEFVPVFLGSPALILGLPVLCMGASFPFVQALVTRRLATVGRRTGLLLFANVAGNVAGTLLVGLVVVDRVGTSGTYRLLGALLVVPAVLAVVIGTSRPAWRVAAAVGVMLVVAVLARFFPSNAYLAAVLHGVDEDHIHVAEDRSCANALRVLGDGREELTVNGASQNDYPFDEFHLLIGLTPALVHDHPARTMALGLGIGATPYGLSLDPRVRQVDAVEICGAEVPLLEDLGERRAPELRRFFADERVEVIVGDGRDHLLRSPEPFDVVVIDTLRQQSAFSGNIYSVEFYEMLRDRLGPDGIVAQWLPTPRVANSMLEVFPHALVFNVPSYGNSAFFLASANPVPFDRAEVLARLAAVEQGGGLPPDLVEATRAFFAERGPTCRIDPSTIGPVAEDAVNRDLRPRDEYFLNNEPAVPERARCVPVAG